MTTRFRFYFVLISLMVFSFSTLAQNPVQIPSQIPAKNPSPNLPQSPTQAPADQPASQPILAQPTAAQPNLSPATDPKNTGSFKRDPFRLPKYLIDKLTYKPPPPPAAVDEQAIDDRVEPIRRWPAKEYLLVGIIWEVKNPKGLVKDLQGRVHVVKLRDRLGNKDGIITAIKEGAITITEKKVPFVLRLKK